MSTRRLMWITRFLIEICWKGSCFCFLHKPKQLSLRFVNDDYDVLSLCENRMRIHASIRCLLMSFMLYHSGSLRRRQTLSLHVHCQYKAIHPLPECQIMDLVQYTWDEVSYYVYPLAKCQEHFMNQMGPMKHDNYSRPYESMRGVMKSKMINLQTNLHGLV